MRRFFKSTAFKIFVAVMAALLLGSFAAAVTYDASSPITSAAATVFAPVQRLSSYVSSRLERFSINFRSSALLEKEIESLKTELAEKNGELVGYEQAQQKLALYEEFLGLKEENPDFEFVSCAVAGKDAADRFESFTLSKGELSGISVNDPVIYGSYLVGVVTSVSPTQCVVSTVLNPNVNVSAYEVRTREAGYLTTTNELSAQGLCRLSGLERATTVAPGGIICTSGIGGIFPADLIIGTVKAVNDDTQDISSYAVVTPQTDISELMDVFVIVSFNGQTTPTAEE